MAKQRGVLVGGGAFGREVLAWAQESARLPNVDWSIYLDQNEAALASFADVGLNWAGDPLSYIPESGDVVLMGIGNPAVKEKFMGKYGPAEVTFASVVHASAVVAATASIGAGVVVGPHSYIATHSIIGDGVAINSLTGIGHDAVIGMYSTISSQADITGGVKLGERVFVGSGARVLPGVTVGDDAKLGAGAVVVRNVKSGSTVYAQPARTI